ncbi:hypothetical protein SANA_00390 [Gottschalkiaceae bacterium SANA]|nr:hypothetical protein SANA_00390 [Gottschalkiaceae bacterium SANA]
MRGIDEESRKYHQKMANREKELQEMIERKERTIEQRIAGQEPGYNKRSIPTPIRRAKHKPNAKKIREEEWLGEQASPRQSSPKQAPQQQEARQSSSRQSSSRQFESRAGDMQKTFQNWGASRSKSSGDNSKTIGRVIRTVVILYVVFGLFAGLVPRIVGNLGEFVSELSEGFSTPEPEPDYEYVTEEVIREEKEVIRTDSMQFIIMMDGWMATLDEAQSYLAYEYTSDSDLAEVESRRNLLQEKMDEATNEITPPDTLSTYWDFFLQEHEWTVMMLTKTVDGESIETDFEQLNLLQYDKFAELVRVWNAEDVEYEVSFRTYDYYLMPVTE